MIPLGKIIPDFKRYVATTTDQTNGYVDIRIPANNVYLRSLQLNSKDRDAWGEVQYIQGGHVIQIGTNRFLMKNDGAIWTFQHFLNTKLNGVIRVISWGPNITVGDRYTVEIIMEE